MKKSGLSLVFSLLVLLGINGQAAAQSTRYTVQLEATQELEIALGKVKGFKGQGLDAYIVKIDVEGKGTFYRIRVGNFPTQADARKYGTDLQRLGFSSDFFIAPYEPPQGDLTDLAPTRGVATPAAGKPSTTAPPAKTQPVKDQPKDVKQPAPPANTPPAAPVTAPSANTQPAKEPAKQPAAVADPAPAPPASTPATTPAATTGNEQKLAANITPSTPNPVTPVASAPPAPAPTALAASSPAVNPAAISFTRFQDQAIGYSFDRPQTWEGGLLDSKDAKDQNVSAGAVFKSAQDSAFITAIWNSLEKANSPEQDNDLIVQLILQSMGSDAQNLTEGGRKVVSENGIIKTYVDFRMTFKPQQGQEGPLDFLGKALIARTNKGILLVATLYWKGAPPYLADVADKIIASVKAPL
jgi:SPOR domain